ncbi:MAG: type II toxin-antitoxin system RatA family toxin [Pseudomonadota bacterium]|uniref:type II toxin-antitoxin system RatA family toxin n=1 Tax=Thermithiobacillus tepidarius TaxID=929 RepID=UPI000401E74C|nr:type II toxin-antitoxin system RatA family toxin [Thermithiobacillus tepidarius]
MHKVQKTAVLPYTPAQVFSMVEDIPSYPAFLPWVSRARILSRKGDEVLAELSFAQGGLSKAFTTRNLHQRNKMIEIRLVNGPFRMLEGLWRFEPVRGGTRVSLDLQFDFSSRLLELLLGPIFKHATETMVNAFQGRARAIYGQDRVAADQIPTEI